MGCASSLGSTTPSVTISVIEELIPLPPDRDEEKDAEVFERGTAQISGRMEIKTGNDFGIKSPQIGFNHPDAAPTKEVLAAGNRKRNIDCDGWTFETHPYVDRKRWLERHEIFATIPKETDASLAKEGLHFDVLTWKGHSKLPFKIKADAWGTDTGADYRVIGIPRSLDMTIGKVELVIPCPPNTRRAKIQYCKKCGTASFSKKRNAIIWRIEGKMKCPSIELNAQLDCPHTRADVLDKLRITSSWRMLSSISDFKLRYCKILTEGEPISNKVVGYWTDAKDHETSVLKEYGVRESKAFISLPAFHQQNQRV